MGDDCKPCRCCFTQGSHKDLNSTYSCLDRKENYAYMLQDCFNIVLSSSIQNGSGICDECICILRVAYRFKQQVLHTEQELMKNVVCEIDTKPVFPKLEPPDSNDEDLQNCSLTDTVWEVALSEVKVAVPDVAINPQKSSSSGERKPVGDVGGLLSNLETRQNNDLTISKKKMKKVVDNTCQRSVRLVTKKRSTVQILPKANSQPPTRKPQTIKLIKVVNRGTQSRHGIVQINKPLRIRPDADQSRLNDTGKDIKICFNDTSVIDKHRSNIRQVLLCSNATLIKKGGLSYSCCFCKELFPNPQTLKQHNLNDHNDEQLGAYNFSELRKYVTTLDITSLQCKLCSKNIDKIEELLAHLKNNHKKEIYLDIDNHIIPHKFDSDKFKCAICGNEYVAFKKLLEHMNIHYQNYVCQFCSAGFVNFSRLYNHLRVHKQMETEPKFKCSHCSKTFKTEMRLRYHSKIHEGLNITCEFCKESFKNFKSRFKHLSEVHGVQFHAYQCHACDKSYDTASSLKIHVKRHHLVERNFACKECDLRFFTRNILQAHMVTHTGARDFQCEFCSKKFGRKKTLREHLRIHLNDRRFECSDCGQTFVQKVSLRYHLRSKHGDKH